jgi:hypothetical protein
MKQLFIIATSGDIGVHEKVTVVYVGEMVSQMLEDGWHSLTF